MITALAIAADATSLRSLAANRRRERIATHFPPDAEWNMNHDGVASLCTGRVVPYPP